MVRLFFDLLHGIERKDVSLANALEFSILLGYDGQLKQNSNMEKQLFGSFIKQLKKQRMSKLENALVWIYAKAEVVHGQIVMCFRPTFGVLSDLEIMKTVNHSSEDLGFERTTRARSTWNVEIQ